MAKKNSDVVTAGQVEDAAQALSVPLNSYDDTLGSVDKPVKVTSDEPAKVEEKVRDFYGEQGQASIEDRIRWVLDKALSLKQPDSVSQERHFWEMAVCSTSPAHDEKARAQSADRMLQEWRTRWVK